MTADAHVGDSSARGAELIRAAFARARESGKPEWRVMTTAVLKNRLLDLTDGAFHEGDWGATTVADFVGQFAGIVDLDRSTRPPTVRLKETQAVAVGESSPLLPLGPRRSIRPDLWRAVLDFTGDERYVWDGEAAIPVAGEEVAGDDSRPALPTLTREEFEAWRAAFVASHDRVPPPARAALEAWRDEGLGTSSLPARFRNLWTAEIKRQVLERLVVWFREQHLELPEDVVATREAQGRHDNGVANLREFVIRCVQAMTQEELETLALPAGAMARTRP